MKRRMLLLAVLTSWAFVDTPAANAGEPCYGGSCRSSRHGHGSGSRETPLGRVAQRRSQMYPWHGAYYETAWGSPVAVVMNPRVGRYTEYAWGVGGFRTQRANHQFGRTYPGGPGEAGFLPTPRWPSDTTQYGSYYVRGPW